MANLFWIPKSPINQQTIQTSDVPPGNGLPSFLGYGTKGALSRFKVPLLYSFRDVFKRHPCSIGSRQGINIPDIGNKMMDISQKFIGNFIITGVTRDKAGVAIGGCSVDLYRTTDDVRILQTTSDSNGNFLFSLPNDSYQAYYMVAYLAGSPDISGVTINTIRTTQQ
jgi:hypothetical protein